MIYFDCAATSLMRPDCVKNAMVQALDSFGNPSRSAHSASLAATRAVTSCRIELARYFHISDPSSVIFTPNATFALNLAIQGLEGHIIATEADHNSVLRPIYKKGNYTFIPCYQDGDLLYDQFEEALRPDTCAVIMTHASNVTGQIYDNNEQALYDMMLRLL